MQAQIPNTPATQSPPIPTNPYSLSWTYCLGTGGLMGVDATHLQEGCFGELLQIKYVQIDLTLSVCRMSNRERVHVFPLQWTEQYTPLAAFNLSEDVLLLIIMR